MLLPGLHRTPHNEQNRIPFHDGRIAPLVGDPTPNARICCLDLDTFFVSVERLFSTGFRLEHTEAETMASVASC